MVMSMNGATSINGDRLNHGFPNGTHVGNSPADGNLDLDRVRERIREDDDGKWDATAFRDQLTLLNGKLLVPEPASGNLAEELTPTPWAVSQMCRRLGIPTAYFRRCPTDLQDAQFNLWARHHDRFETNGFDDYNTSSTRNGVNRNPTGRNGSQSGSSHERWLLRVKHDSVRGVLSDRYTRLDNEPFLDCLQPLLPSRLQVKWFALTGESLHLRLIDPTLAREVLPDDRIMVGLHLANSEVGKRSVTVDAIVWRLVCQNGLVRLVKGKSLLQQRHIFVSQSNFKRDLERAMGEALTTAAGLLEKLAQSTTEHLDDVETLIEKIGERHNLSEAFQERIKNALLLENRGQQETLYGFTNALTQAAQTLPPDERYGLEVLAGEVMERGTLWLNGLPKAKVKRKAEMVAEKPLAGTGSSSFVSAASPLPTHRSRLIWDARPDAEIAAVKGFAPVHTPVAVASEESNAQEKPEPIAEGQPVQQATELIGSTVVAKVSPEPSRVSPAPPIASVHTVSLSERNVRIERSPSDEPIPGKSDKPASPAQKDVICALCSRRGLGTYDLHYLMQQEFDKGSLEELTQDEATRFTILLQQRSLNELTAPVPEYDEDGELDINFDEE